MPIDPDIVADCPYAPGGFLIDEVIEVDLEESRVVCEMATHEDLPITREQRAHPIRHPRHVSGGLMVHMTGMVAFVHFYLVLGMRHADGWIGYGGKIYRASFAGMAEPGIPLRLECKMTRQRTLGDKMVARYDFRFTQQGRLIYEGDQVAMWMKVAEDASR